MPWNPGDATRHNKAANTPAKRKQWAAVANSILEKTGNEGQAVKGANSALKHTKASKGKKHKAPKN